MPEKRDVDAEQTQLIDELAAETVGLLRKGLQERPFGLLTVTYHWKAGVLSKLVTHEGGERLLNLSNGQG